ncbi:MAG: peptidase inhibitor family I36 protein [Pseudonocardiaceae bacterium]
MSTPECPPNNVCFYSEPEFQGEVQSYPAPVDSCVTLPFPAMSYQNNSNGALIGYMEPDCEGEGRPIDSSDPDLDPPILSFGPAQ